MNNAISDTVLLRVKFKTMELVTIIPYPFDVYTTVNGNLKTILYQLLCKAKLNITVITIVSNEARRFIQVIYKYLTQQWKTYLSCANKLLQ